MKNSKEELQVIEFWKIIRPSMEDLFKTKGWFDLLYYLGKSGGISTKKIAKILQISYQGAKNVGNKLKKLGIFYNPESDDVKSYEKLIRTLENKEKIPRRFIIPTNDDLIILEDGKTLSGFALSPNILSKIDQFNNHLMGFIKAIIVFSKFISGFVELNQNKINTIL